MDDEVVSTDVPEFLRRWSEEGRAALEKGEVPLPPEAYISPNELPPEESKPFLPPGITTRAGVEGFIVRHGKRHVGTCETLDDAMELKAWAVEGKI